MGRLKMVPVEGSTFTLEAELVLLAMGFTQPVHEGLLDGLGVEYDARGNVKTDESMKTSVDGVYAAGDAQSGAWLVVGAIAGARRMARSVDEHLMGETALPDVPERPKL
jgi:glutamate synthase (NADPH/NADH) small chain